uniref:Uncharacterized protein n=1 Tax=Molossus molossus TaxID=27622 RepID=A0A7J8CRN8_MOLMO|nr:hypothetical protein HJG59_009746 [Molossus molossus]
MPAAGGGLLLVSSGVCFYRRPQMLVSWDTPDLCLAWMPARVREMAALPQEGLAWSRIPPGSRFTGLLGMSGDRGFRFGAASTLAVGMGGGVTGRPGCTTVSTSPQRTAQTHQYPLSPCDLCSIHH